MSVYVVVDADDKPLAATIERHTAVSAKKALGVNAAAVVAFVPASALAEAEALIVRLTDELRTYTRVDRRLDGICCKRCGHRVPDHEPDCEIGHLLTEASRDR